MHFKSSLFFSYFLVRCPPDKILPQSMFVLYEVPPTVTDNSGGQVTFEYNPPSGSFFSVTSVVTVRATYANGNSDTCTFNVIVSQGEKIGNFGFKK